MKPVVERALLLFVALVFCTAAPAKADERALTREDVFKDCATDCPEMVAIPTGSFAMGSTANEAGHQPSEDPRHKVTIAKPFAVSKFAVTFAEWDACVAGGECASHIDDGGWGRGRQPVINVSWEDAQHYVTWLSRTTGKAYRLLTEAEYEYAARAGTQTAYPWGDEIGHGNANCAGCDSRWDLTQPAPVGSFAPNRFGLYDMVGNVWAWVEDCLHEDYSDTPPVDGSAWMTGGDCSKHRLRGGSWTSDPHESVLQFAAEAEPMSGPLSSASGSLGRLRLERITPRAMPSHVMAPPSPGTTKESCARFQLWCSYAR